MLNYLQIQPANYPPSPRPVSNMLNKLHGQPDSYDKKLVYTYSICRNGALS